MPSSPPPPRHRAVDRLNTDAAPLRRRRRTPPSPLPPRSTTNATSAADENRRRSRCISSVAPSAMPTSPAMRVAAIGLSIDRSGVTPRPCATVQMAPRRACRRITANRFPTEPQNRYQSQDNDAGTSGNMMNQCKI